jgi:hypothetical protein
MAKSARPRAWLLRRTVTMSLSTLPYSFRTPIVPQSLRGPALRPCPRTIAVLVVTLIALLSAGQARAALTPASLIDGPSSAILDVDGAAMAPDGSGGILYRKLVDGQPRLFVSRFLDGAWQPPIQVDAGQPFGASFAKIAAGNDGRLLVVWAEPWAIVGTVTHDRLMSAGVEPGASEFGPAIPIDDLGDGTAAYPSLAMAPNGVAYVAYRVVTDSLQGETTVLPLRAGDELIDVRVARYNGQGLPWSRLGAINAHPQLTMRHPSASNAPSIGVGLTGNAIVAWQEPDTSGTARIWARRIFGTRLGNVLEVSQSEVGGRPVAVDADAPAVAVNTFGEAEVAFRLAGGPSSPYAGNAEILNNRLPAETDPAGAQFKGARALGGATTVGTPSVSVEKVSAFRLSYVASLRVMAITGDNYHGDSSPLALGVVSGSEAPNTVNPAGGGVTAWSSTNAEGMPVVVMRQDFPDGAWQLAQLAAPISGPAGEPTLGGSGQGDALIAFRQGPDTQSQVMAAVAKAPPGAFLASTASGWMNRTAATVSWEPAPEGFGATSYRLVVDGRVGARLLTGLRARIYPSGLGDGVHSIQIVATDSSGQQTATPRVPLKVDSGPPEVSVRRLSHDAVSVRVHDRGSGAVANATSIAFGDGARASRRLLARHTYAHAGQYVIVVRSRDRVHNGLFAHVRVQVG